MRFLPVVFSLLLSITCARADGLKGLIPSLEDVFADVYAGMSAFEISTEEKESMKKSGNTPTYGELTPRGIRIVVEYMLERLKVFFGDTLPEKINFIDIGSGAGKVPFGACIEGPFAKCLGVEYSKERHVIAVNAYKKMMANWAHLFIDGREVVFINEDALKTDMRKVLAVYISSLCFEAAFMEKLLDKLEKELPDGAIIITSKAFQTKNGRMKLIRRFTLPQTWKADSKAHAYQMGLKGVLEVRTN